MAKKQFFIIDFDSTFIKIESLECLAEIALERNPKKEKIIKKMREITEQGMKGEIPYNKSLEDRIKLFKAEKKDIEKTIKVLKKNITPSIVRNKAFFNKFKENIYIISGGFREYIAPLFKSFGISENHILANEFIFDKKGKIIGYDKNNVLSKDGGKIKQIKALELNGKVYVIGDGYTDYEVKKVGLAEKFFVFCENIKRENITKKADYILPNFDEFLYVLDLPRAYSYPKNRINVLLLENISNKAVERFEKEGFSVKSVPHAIEENELVSLIEDVTILGIRSRTTISKDVLGNAKRLLTIGAYCIGVNQINLKEASIKGVPVFNAPYSNTRSVVELVIGEIIMLARGITDKSERLHKGEWVKDAKGSHEIRGKKLGIVGYGNIGSQLSVLAELMGMKVYFYDAVDKLSIGNAIKCNSLKELCHEVDIVTIHVDGREANKNLIDERVFNWMKPGALFLNLSRGSIVNIDALVKNLEIGKIKGAAIDVFPEEPKRKSDPFISKLQGLKNVILTPHIGGSTEEAQDNIGLFVTDKLLSFINSGNTNLSVNFPHLQLPALTDSHRLVHIHKNVPGVLAKINNILAQHSINIEGQYLKTEEEIGYVITDVNKFYNNSVTEDLRKIEETIKFRLLY